MLIHDDLAFLIYRRKGTLFISSSAKYEPQREAGADTGLLLRGGEVIYTLGVANSSGAYKSEGVFACTRQLTPFVFVRAALL